MKFDKSRIGQERAKFAWLDHVQLVIYKLCDDNIRIAFLLRCKLCQTYRYKYECSLVKNLLTHLGD